MAAIKKDISDEFAAIISSFGKLSRKEKSELLSYLANDLGRTQELIYQEKEIFIPCGIFRSEYLSCLESIVKYLKEKSKLKFSRIAKLTNRSSKTIWTTYRRASKKMPLPFGEISNDLQIPVSALSDRYYSTLESVVCFLKDMEFSNHEVAQMLLLDDRTVWTVYDRIKKKRGISK